MAGEDLKSRSGKIAQAKRSKSKPRTYRGKRQAKRSPVHKKVVRKVEPTEGFSVYYLCPLDKKEVERIQINRKPVNRWECPSCGTYYFRHQLIKKRRPAPDQRVNSETNGKL